MSTIKVDTIATRTGSGNITVSNNIAGAGTISGTNISASGTLAVTGTTTTAAITSTGRHDVNFNGSGTQAFKYTDTGGGNLASFGQFYNPSNALIGNIQNANNDGIHIALKNGSICFGQVGFVDANALDDYEEGQWTPNVYNAARTSNFSTKKGDYVRIGRVVHCWWVVDHGNSNSGSGTGNLTLEGMPFSVQVEATSGSTFAHNSTQSVGIWGANPSSQVGNIFTAGSATTFLLYKGGVIQTSQVTYASGSFSYICQP